MLRLKVLLLGADRNQALRASQALLPLIVYAVFGVVQHLEVLAGLIDEAASWKLTAWNFGGGLLFYGTIRSGLNLRLVQKNRALSVPQMLWAMVGISWSYAITGPARGAVILIMVVVILYGVFALSANQSRQLLAAGIGMLGVVMAWKGFTDPQHYDPRVEATHFAFTGIVLSAVSILSVRVGKMRLRLQAQRGELTQALERIQALATRDDLTGLLNRRAVLERLQVELRERDAKPLLCLAIIDLDHFKQVNDSFGHAAGDEVLRRFAEAARQEVRGSDVLARWGGEEFLLVMPGASAEQGLHGLERIRARLHRVTMDDIHPGMRVTFSAGVAVCCDPGNVEQTIERADAAMYQAKSHGRDCSMSAESNTVALTSVPLRRGFNPRPPVTDSAASLVS